MMITVAGNKKSPGMLASIRTVLQVFRKELRKGSLRFRNLGSNRQLTVGQLNYLAPVPSMDAAGVTIWQRLK